jgi:lipopolysaccharide transport system ATP-binding protein
MSDIVIRATRIAKRYRIGQREQYTALRDVLARCLQAPANLLRKDQAPRQASPSDLWAIKEISFDIRRGEIVGILGRNGAGKSTLLKILARITKPTCGHAEIRGRMGTLLEVGTGFHPELTGRENIYLSGAILGMRKVEINRRFDEIVNFSEIEKFIDTPLKHYSSGMQMRLAFAVAAHLEPEILLIDEVLAVGDMEFQRKCLNKMKDISRGGRTVLFVSHNIAAVQSLCTRAIVLKSGAVYCDAADAAEGIAAYGGLSNTAGSQWHRPHQEVPEGPISFQRVECVLLGTQPRHQLQIVAEVKSQRHHAGAHVAFDLLDAASVPIMQAMPTLSPFVTYSSNGWRIDVVIDLPPLIPGSYAVTCWVGPHNTVTYDYVHSVVSFEILTSPTTGRSYPHTRDHGQIVPNSVLKTVSELRAQGVRWEALGTVSQNSLGS